MPGHTLGRVIASHTASSRRGDVGRPSTQRGYRPFIQGVHEIALVGTAEIIGSGVGPQRTRADHPLVGSARTAARHRGAGCWPRSPQARRSPPAVGEREQASRGWEASFPGRPGQLPAGRCPLECAARGEPIGPDQASGGRQQAALYRVDQRLVVTFGLVGVRPGEPAYREVDPVRCPQVTGDY
jgi:hypothetical protein